MMKRLLIVPGAGRILTRVSGRPLLDYLERRYRRAVDSAVLVVSSSTSDAIRARLAAFGLNAAVVSQPDDAGEVDAILRAAPSVLAARPDRVWITWYDQIAIRPETIARLQALEQRDPDADVILPMARVHEPDTHFEFDDIGRVSTLLRRQQGDPMPAEGISHTGLFSLSRRAFLEDLRWFSADAKDFVPFLEGRKVVRFPAAADEAPGAAAPHIHPRVSIVPAGDGMRDRIARAAADFILIHDAGVECTGDETARMLQVLRDSDADIVHASRHITRRAAWSVAGSLIALAYSRKYLTDIRAPLRLYPKSLLLAMDLQNTGPGLGYEMLAKSLARGMRIVEVPVSEFAGIRAEGRKTGLKDWFRALR